MQAVSRRLSKLEQSFSARGQPGRVFRVKCGSQTGDEINDFLQRQGFDRANDRAMVRRLVQPGTDGPLVCDSPISLLNPTEVCCG